jgi:hypothetical protein
MNQLPEFRVSLTRCKRGETAYPISDEIPLGEYHGRRTKLGGKPDWEQGQSPNPKCERCGKRTTFVAQIDSVEHDWRSNPHRIDCLTGPEKLGRPKWMFGDVGMIYVFFCFECLLPAALFECG